MSEEIIKLSPDTLGYKDRGKMKWIGMMLSDHAEALNNQQQQTQSATVLPRDKQTLETVSALLFESYTRKKPVAIQLDILKDGHYLPDTQGIVKGANAAAIYIKDRSQIVHRIPLDTIRHVRPIESAACFQKTLRQSVSE
ncbi:hypothetical protein ADIAL_0539 [Alkalibacterium sp. AK22]|uniref:YolD-like family protein n=1 Tax=Alkalibacterium sp. AK22 TaxID=1229520 RepID=UPI00044FB79C|nr:YolD-like family protein [Alkalibacterium sp. AK22]EXJ24019.1 hypothetical protein ADIAL_0539 [Alkalibacterium sp. AK22]